VGDVALGAIETSRHLVKYLERGFDVVSLTPSCSLMLKSEWPLLVPDENVKRLSKSTFDVTEYIVKISKDEGLIPGLKPLPDDVFLHHACHARAQNMGFQSEELLKNIPNVKLSTIERCSGHGGSFGCKTEFFPIAMKVGQPVFRQACKTLEKSKSSLLVASECPLAGTHIRQGMETMAKKEIPPARHPIEILAMSYGLMSQQ